ncbi:response regulator [Iodobacter fluviatilis]|uniref:Transcriptional regulatory protein OmpR n=1 Tax=Iodobacter fluviatilis TaxID=537 RepID=A0A377QAE6_9NEIS|nr:response regulator [Iodobacter fluviatilis]TCU81908.1 two-component system OmpR family response regulator [Iodobacter fluviatilis]STQ91559.1 Transcriptional regulatory protein OmpR [Iodobacter fluviatilis]
MQCKQRLFMVVRGAGAGYSVINKMDGQSMGTQILLVDDDVDLRVLLSDYLGDQGYAVTAVGDGIAMHRAMEQGQFDLLILDLMLPGEDGLTLCRNLRASSNLPVLMLTARGDELDRIIGLEMGADDYLPKPFNPRELLARIKSILRRAADPTAGSKATRLCFAGWELDLAAQYLLGADGVVTSLSTGEFRLLQALAENANRVLSRDQLMDAINGKDAAPFDRTIDVMIGRLRRRLGDEAREAVLIKTIRSSGYMLVCKVEAR